MNNASWFTFGFAFGVGASIVAIKLGFYIARKRLEMFLETDDEYDPTESGLDKCPFVDSSKTVH